MEPLLSQLTDEIARMFPNSDLIQTRSKLAAVLACYDIKPVRIIFSNPDLSEKVKAYLASKKLEGLSPLTLVGYELELSVFGKYIQKPVAEITTNEIRSFLGQFSHLKTSSLSRKLSVLKSFFGWLTEEEIILRDPTRKIKNPKTVRGLPKALGIDELEMMREACRTARERAMVEVFYSTGSRLAEIHNLNQEDINWQERCVKVVGKGSIEREVLFSFKAVYHLKKYLDSREDEEHALFVTERRPYRRLSRRGFQREIKLIALRAGITKRVHPHVMRHTLGTLLLNNGADLVAVQAILGHSNPATTQIYARLSDKRKREQYRKYLVQ